MSNILEKYFLTVKPLLAIGVILGFLQVNEAQAQFTNCVQCLHGGKLAQGAYTTNCLGQPTPSFVRPGETVAVVLAIGYNDNCTGNLATGANDESLMTNIIDVVDFGTSKVTNSISINPPILLRRGDPDVPIVNILTGPFAGAAYLLTVPLDATKEIHSAISHGVDTNSLCNPGGDVGGIGSAQLIVIRPAITVTKRCLTAVNPAGNALIVTFSGTISNSGDAPLSGIVVVNNQPAPNTTVFTTPTLEVGASVTFTNTYTNTVNLCGPFTDTLTVTAVDAVQCPVSSSSSDTCTIVYTPAINVSKFCPAGPVQPGGTLTFSGTVSNSGNVVLTNVIVFNDKPAPNTVLVGPITLGLGQTTNFTGSYTVPIDSCGPYSDTLTARATSICGLNVTNTDTAICPGTNAPAIIVSKNCTQGPLQPGQLLTITGTVTNIGNITLTNVTVTNTIAALGGISRQILGPLTLAPGAGTNFTDSYTLPLDSCGPYRDTVLASGADKCFGRVVTATDFKDCPGTNSPSIAVTKNCPPGLVQPGQLLIITGTVTNTGNITLTNVTVTNTIAALGNVNRQVLAPTVLAPGAGITFTDTYMVPLDSCGPYRDTVVAMGADKCFGRIVSATDFKDCFGITSPRIAVTKKCPANPVVPGGIAIFSGTVSNAGNITLTNVLVVNNRPTNNTPVFGPVTLLPGQGTNFTGSEVVPPNCCEYFDTLTAVGANTCTGSNVMASASAVCPTLVIPRITVTKNCPPAPVPLGQPLIFMGTVSNAGNIALINVTVVDNQPSNNTPVLGPLTLAPGESANFNGSYTVPINICDTNIADTVTARGTDVCAGSNVTATAGALCPIVPTPRLTVTKKCPANPVAPGQLLVFTGTVSNSGSITITNIIVVNDRPIPNTIIIGQPFTLVPGQTNSFTGSYIAPYDCCGPCVDTITATGNEICLGSNVVATASAACPRITTPGLAVTRDCPSGPVTQGDLVFITGVVTNTGNATLANVTIMDDQAGNVLDNLVLAPGEAVPYLGMYITTNCGPNLPAAVTATGNDVCTGVVVSNRFVTTCGVLCPQVQAVILFNVKLDGGKFSFSFLTELSQSYIVQYTDSLNPVNWQPLGSPVPGTGGQVTVNDNLTTGQRFYRVQVQ